MSDTPDSRCESYAREHYGVLHQAEAMALGMSKDAFNRRVRAGRWKKLHERVVILPGAPESWLAELRGALHWAGPGAFASHRAAAAVYELDGVVPKGPEISLPSGRRTPGVITHRLQTSDSPPTRVLKHITVPHVPRVLLDLGAVTSVGVVRLALEDALRKRLTTLGLLRQTLASNGGMGRPGTSALKYLLARMDPSDAAVRTVFETKMLGILKAIGVPYRADHRVEDGRRIYFFDFAYPRHRIGVECHSIRWHMGEEKWRKDIVRDRHLRALGWQILYFTWEDVTSQPEMVRDEICKALEAAQFS